MAERERPLPTDEERAERRREEQELTERAVSQLRSSAGWQRWLECRAKVGLRRYSLTNQLLCCLQDPGATHVAGFRAWLKLGYSVRRGETSHIWLWAPCPPSKRKLQAWRDAGAIAADKPRTYFRLQAVFSASQVEPLPPPAQPAPLDPPIAELQGDSLAWAREPLERLADELGYRVTYETLAKGHGGSCAPAAKLVSINDDQAVNAQISVLCHELGHALVRVDRREDDPKLAYAEEELVAESVAHLAVAFVGVRSDVSSVPYLAAWSEDAGADTFERVAGLVDRLARRLEEALGAEQREERQPAAPAVAA